MSDKHRKFLSIEKTKASDLLGGSYCDARLHGRLRYGEGQSVQARYSSNLAKAVTLGMGAQANLPVAASLILPPTSSS